MRPTKNQERVMRDDAERGGYVGIARSDVPLLLAEIDALRKDLDMRTASMRCYERESDIWRALHDAHCDERCEHTHESVWRHALSGERFRP